MSPSAKQARRYGWRPDTPDHRDYKFVPTRSLLRAPPQKVDNRPLLMLPYDQFQLGSCTGQACAGEHQARQIRQHLAAIPRPTAAQVAAAIKKSWCPSRLAIYYDERVIEGTVNQDAGAEIRDGIKVLAKKGAAPETLWPYNTAKFAKKPTAAYYAEAVKHTALRYERVTQTLSHMLAALADTGSFIFGFSVYESFESDTVTRTGVVPMPRTQERLLGGHAVMAVGYDQAKRWFIVRNSWGTRWGDKGYFYMPFDYLLNDDLSADFWRVLMLKAA